MNPLAIPTLLLVAAVVLIAIRVRQPNAGGFIVTIGAIAIVLLATIPQLQTLQLPSYGWARPTSDDVSLYEGPDEKNPIVTTWSSDVYLAVNAKTVDDLWIAVTLESRQLWVKSDQIEITGANIQPEIVIRRTPTPTPAPKPAKTSKAETPESANNKSFFEEEFSKEQINADQSAQERDPLINRLRRIPLPAFLFGLAVVAILVSLFVCYVWPGWRRS
jgi:hypothetical protein